MKIIFEVKSLTPIFVGSGEDSIVHYDSLIKGGRIYFVDLNKLAEYFINEPHNIVNPNVVSRIIGKIGLKNLSKYSLELQRPQNLKDPSKVKLFIKDAYGKPYIPGTSLKGSIRTAVLWKSAYQTDDLANILRNIGRINRRKPGDDKDLIRIFLRGKEDDPKYDIMKAVTVRDVKLRSYESFVMPIKIINIVKRRELRFRVWIEAVFVKKAYIEIVIDEKLIRSKELSFPENAKKAVLNLESTIREYSKFLLGKLGRIGNANSLIDEANRTTLLYVGWGGGWNAMTGSLISERDKSILFRNREFPVSRRLVYYNGNWVLPGWLRLRKIVTQ